MSKVRLVLASANPDKAREIAALLSEFDLIPRPKSVPDVVEDGDSLEANARLKAVALVEATGEAAVADDTGLEIDSLNGAPGIYAARYSGEGATYESNVAKVLADLDAIGARGADARRARFRTVALARFPDGREFMAEGVLEGEISAEPMGDNGFGYDPIFIPADGDGRALGEMDADEKHAISHRGRAFRALARLLAD